MLVMKALSIKEPWCSLIASGAKTIELRSRVTHYRGPVLLCASKSPAVGFAGYAFAIANIIDCTPATPADTARSIHPAEGWCWHLADVTLLAEPFPVRGQLGLFSPTIDQPLRRLT